MWKHVSGEVPGKHPARWSRTETTRFYLGSVTADGPTIFQNNVSINYHVKHAETNQNSNISIEFL